MASEILALLADPLFGIVAFLAIAFTIATINSFAMKGMHTYPSPTTGSSPQELPLISILVPARNEEENIGACVGSLLNQDYPNFELLVLDDHSTDHTGRILAELAAQDPRLRVLQGQDLPEGWVGKNWACHQLSEAAQGEYILFVDADTIHAPGTLGHALSAMLAEKLEMLTALPRQAVLTWGEKLIVPIMYFSLLSFMPLPLAYRLRLPVFSAAIGQFIFFKRTAYDQIGGYAAVRAHGTDDLALARQVKSYHLTWRLVDGGKLVHTRMYRSYSQALNGFSKNLFAAFDYRILPFLFVWLWMGYIFYRPPLELTIRLLLDSGPPHAILLCIFGILEALLLWMLATWRLRFPRYIFLFYLVIAFMCVYIALRSIYRSFKGKSTWKDRPLDRPTIRWI